MYKPNLAETWPIIKQMIDEHANEAFTKAAMKAQQILLDDLLIYHDGWHVAASGDTGDFYTIEEQYSICRCPARLPVVNGRTFCKHQMALAVYKQVLVNNLNAIATLVDVEERFQVMWDGTKWTFVIRDSIYQFARFLGLNSGNYESYSYEPEIVADTETEMFLAAERDGLQWEREVGYF